jgi:hypothetical protein
MAKQVIEINVPEGYELVKTATGFEVVEVEKENVELCQVDKNDYGIIAETLERKQVAWIADGHAPEGLKHKCVSLNPRFNWEFTTYNGRHILIPTRK